MKKALGILTIMIIVLLISCGKDYEVTISLNVGIDTVEIHEVWTDSGALLDTETDQITVYSSDSVDTSELGEYEIVYTYIYEGEEYSITRFVMVADQTNPIITLLSGIDTVQLNEDWVDGGCSVTDNSEEILICSTESVVDITEVGVYEVIYTAEDSSGNEGTITRIVTVVE
jgi:hypothetical protein